MTTILTRTLAVLSLASLVASGPAFAQEPPDEIAGPVEARVVKVRDGDTIEVEAYIWPMQSVHVAVRLRGIDAPEKRGRCEAEKRAAAVATERLSELVASGRVTLSGIEGDKYFGRVLASVSTEGTADVAKELLKDGLVVRYGGKARLDWCSELSSIPAPTTRPKG
ncbi:MAG: thermonuclease family protein [Fulvimarina manganoxydans]|uniref:thermonuclease family protein n=1 Tax=Fulvimarina manganoxydans TaxID=937218 RepID=UPI00235294C7|nr:thermonuclease family protein [Fulvimarina manganoxydans]MCK5932036.1 thermonuclease family protein [Fulvimarina manganoxydans]